MQLWPGNLYRSKTDPDILLQVESVTANADGFIVAVSFPEDGDAGDMIELLADEWNEMSAHFQLIEAAA